MTRLTNRGRATADPDGVATGPARLVARIDGVATLREVYGVAATREILAEVDRRLAGFATRALRVRRLGDGAYALAARSADPAEIDRLIGRLQLRIGGKTIRTSAGPAVATLSVGAACGKGACGAELLRNAETAVGQAARRAPDGRCVAVAGPGAHAETVASARRALAALREGRLAVAYQPVLRADRPDAPGSVVFSECLARILEPSGEIVAAGAFMPALERLGLTRPVDRRVLEFALEELAAAPTLRLSVNLSAQSLGDPGWLAILEASEAARPGLAARLIVEITESAVIPDEARARAFVAEMRRFGCALALDDFGAGFSAFRHLKSLRPDILKIDGGFVEGLGADPDNRALIASIMVAARHFEMMTVAERVNAPADAAALRELGVDAFQGHAYGRPTIEPDWRVDWAGQAAI